MHTNQHQEPFYCILISLFEPTTIYFRSSFTLALKTGLTKPVKNRTYESVHCLLWLTRWPMTTVFWKNLRVI